jgi:hypothetical protein
MNSEVQVSEIRKYLDGTEIAVLYNYVEAEGLPQISITLPAAAEGTYVLGQVFDLNLVLRE